MRSRTLYGGQTCWRRRWPPRRREFARAGSSSSSAALAGVLVAALVLPVVGLVGLSARETARPSSTSRRVETSRSLPESSRILAADGSLMAQFFDENRVYVPLAEVAPVIAGRGHRDRGLPLLRARRRRPARHPARVRQQPVRRGRPRVGRRSPSSTSSRCCSSRPQTDEKNAQAARDRTLDPQDPRAAATPSRLEERLHQGRDPRALPQHRLLRRRARTASRRRPATTSAMHADELNAARGRHARRHRAAAPAVSTRPATRAARGGPPQHRAQPHGTTRLRHARRRSPTPQRCPSRTPST